tara:strand:- start:3433 stop:3681 length:249 start_codon:yes stop_codon:yes gene_type:complete
MKDRSKIIEEVRNIINGKNKEKDPFSCGLQEFIHIIKNMNWNELRKLATSVNISVNNKRREEIVNEINAAYMRKNKKGHNRP